MYGSVVSLKTYGPRGSPSGKPPRRLFRKQKEAGQEEREEKKTRRTWVPIWRPQ